MGGKDKGLGKPTHTLVPWRQGFRHSTRNECMGWFAQIEGRTHGVTLMWVLFDSFLPMIGENQQLVTNEPVEFEK